MATIVDSDLAIATNSDPETLTVTLVGVQAGDCIVVCGGCEGAETISFADDRSNTYGDPPSNFDILHGGGLPRGRVSVAQNVASGTTVITMTLSAQQYRILAAVALRGSKTSGAASASNGSSGSSAAPAPGNVTIGAIGAVVVWMVGAGALIIDTPSGYTQLEESESGSASVGQLAYKNVTGGTENPTFTVDQETPPWVAIAVLIDDLTGQIARPDVDINDGGWTPSAGADLFATVDETSANDTDYMRSGASPSNDEAEIGLSDVTTPEAGDVTLRVRAKLV